MGSDTATSLRQPLIDSRHEKNFTPALTRPIASHGAHESLAPPEFLMPISQTCSAVLGTWQSPLAVTLRPQPAAERRSGLLPVLAGLAMAFTVSGASATSFNMTSGTRTTAGQTLGAVEAGNVVAAATLRLSGSDVAMTLSGDDGSIVSPGKMKQTGTGRLVRDNTGVAGSTATSGTDNSPLPLPPSLALFLAGVGCIGLLYQRRRPG